MMGSSAAPLASSLGERRRRRIVQWIFVLFCLLVLEGALRKWLFPQYAQYIFFIRDPIALAIYMLAAQNGAFRGPPPLLAIGAVFAVVMIPIAFLQAASAGSFDVLLFSVYGWRNYFFYLPLPFVIATQFTRQDLYTLCKISLVALILSAPLAVMQFYSPETAPINGGIAEETHLQFTSMRSANGHIRPAGPFTSILGMVELTASSAALALMCWIVPRRERRISTVLLVFGAAAIAASLAVSGSRTMFVHVGLVVAAAMASGLLMRRANLMFRATTLPLLLVGAFAVLFPLLFSEGYSTISSRWEEAEQAERQSGGMVGRSLSEFYDFLRVIGDVPLLGYGLGLGGNAATTLKATAESGDQIPYVESDWSRHMVDLGSVLGVLFILYRVAFTLWLAREAGRATQRTADPLPLLLFGYVSVLLLQGQMTGNGVINGFCWLYVGFCMAACRRDERLDLAPASKPTVCPYPNLMTDAFPGTGRIK